MTKSRRIGICVLLIFTVILFVSYQQRDSAWPPPLAGPGSGAALASDNAVQIPVLVLVTPSVSAAKKARLEADGATVLQVEPVPLPSWINLGSDRWKDSATKLRLFALTEYDKICFIDADHLITAPLDGVFLDPATNTTQTFEKTEAVLNDEPTLPPSYMFASRPDTWGPNHDVPPREDDYLNAGFFVFRPSEALLDYYLGVLEIENRFPGKFFEQDLFNYAHRREGNMPWRSLQPTWNVNWPTGKDYDAGVRSFHGKYWDPKRKHDPFLLKNWQERMVALRAFYDREI
ncbi:nucleotide-diphospho-sugar transferase [Thozetella sp. PMI_491]|nr:nucleotide-diphospho-sugar transferase [Thozetella sp. PMI_491]